ncbi:MAG: RrF2 family transcriptional regulator [Dehalococcoidia bacterium]|mgnify:FL=1|nr:Rrf2 family transcriptional regulator [Chloroflexota bacterium]|tara:strand:- start:909 stop:1400 length:492 start_codon:yes stop_codon:yes gene_type:complete
MNNPITCYYSNSNYGDKNMLIPMKVDYGVRILVYLASFPHESIVKAADISKQRHIPEKFLFQISNDLIDKKLIKSLRGPKGGYSLGRNASDISVADVIESLDKSMAPVACLDNSDSCEISGNCAQQNMWSDVEQTLISKLEMITIKDLADKEKPIIESIKLEN